jgi:hypothetical protein
MSPSFPLNFFTSSCPQEVLPTAIRITPETAGRALYRSD